MKFLYAVLEVLVMNERILMTIPVFVVVGALAACSSSGKTGTGGGSGSVSGTVGGTTFTVGSGVAIIGQNTSSSCFGPTADGGESCTSATNGYIAQIILANLSILSCSFIESSFDSNASYANADALELSILNPNGDITAGTYDIVAADAGEPGNTNIAAAEFSTTTSTCGDGLDVMASSGTITVSAVSATSISGTYDITFGSQGSFAGSFDSPACAVPDAGSTSSEGDGGTTCVK
jgi:hypothetical protein